MEGREKERERNINVWLLLTHPLLGTWPTTQACTLTGNRTSNPLLHRMALSPLSHTSQGYMFTLHSFWCLPSPLLQNYFYQGSISKGPFLILILLTSEHSWNITNTSPSMSLSLYLCLSLFCHLLLLHPTSSVWFPWSSVKDPLLFFALFQTNLFSHLYMDNSHLYLKPWPLPWDVLLLAWLLHLVISMACRTKLLTFSEKHIPLSVFLISVNDVAPYNQNSGWHPWFLPFPPTPKLPLQALSILNTSQICLPLSIPHHHHKPP